MARFVAHVVLEVDHLGGPIATRDALEEALQAALEDGIPSGFSPPACPGSRYAIASFEVSVDGDPPRPGRGSTDPKPAKPARDTRRKV